MCEYLTISPSTMTSLSEVNLIFWSIMCKNIRFLPILIQILHFSSAAEGKYRTCLTVSLQIYNMFLDLVTNLLRNYCSCYQTLYCYYHTPLSRTLFYIHTFLIVIYIRPPYYRNFSGAIPYISCVIHITINIESKCTSNFIVCEIHFENYIKQNILWMYVCIKRNLFWDFFFYFGWRDILNTDLCLKCSPEPIRFLL
jgi:hypothetical protein